MKSFLKIKDLSISVEDKNIIRNLNLKINKGEEKNGKRNVSYLKL